MGQMIVGCMSFWKNILCCCCAYQVGSQIYFLKIDQSIFVRFIFYF